MNDQLEGNTTATQRCPECNALLPANALTCAECELLAKHPAQPTANVGPDQRLGLWGRVVGLGIPVDIWALTAVCVIYLLIRLFVLGVSDGLLAGCLQILFPVAMIAFSDFIGGFTGFYRGIHIDQEAHPSFVKLVGWGFLLLIMVWSCYAMFSGELNPPVLQRVRPVHPF